MAAAGPTASEMDAIFQRLGPSGRFTILQLLCLSLGTFPCIFQLLSNVFIGMRVGHRCASPSNESSLTSSDFLFGENPAADDVTVEYGECAIVVRRNQTVTQTTDCVYGVQYDQPLEASVISQFDLVCSRAALFHLSQTCLIAGQGLGVLVGTVLADRFGRRKVTVGCNFGLLATGLVIAFAPNYLVFTCAKFLAGAFQQAYLSTSATLSLEILTMSTRRWGTTIEGIRWTVGISSLALLAYLLRHHSWRVLQLTLSLSSLGAFVQLWYIKESLRWLGANGRNEEVRQYVCYAAKLNGQSCDDVIGEGGETSWAFHQVDGAGAEGDTSDRAVERAGDVKVNGRVPRRLSMIDVVKRRRLLINFGVMSFTWFTALFSYLGLYLISKPTVTDTYLNVFLTSIAEIPGMFFMHFALNRLGRKRTFISLISVLSFGFIASGIFSSLEESVSNSVLVLVGTLIAAVGASGAMRLVYGFTLELFPTNIRNQALGLCNLCGRFGGMTAPFMSLVGEQARWSPGMVIGGLSFLVALLLRFLPETSGRELPQTLEELHQWKDKPAASLKGKASGKARNSSISSA